MSDIADIRQRWRVIHGDVRAGLASLPEQSAHVCVTSPPYWGLRDYGVDGQIGLEGTPEQYIAAMVEVFRGVRRVLRDDGTLWLNIGDAYWGGGRGGNPEESLHRKQATNAGSLIDAPNWAQMDCGVKPKDLVGLPWMLAFALRADGWYLRSDIIWHKPNPMPESVTDRPTKGHEYLFLLAKNARYYYDAAAIAEASVDPESLTGRNPRNADAFTQKYAANFGATRRGFAKIETGKLYETRNRRTVWTIPTQPFPEAHFATFPEALVEPCIKAGSPVGGTVLDPFSGSGTTGVVALKQGRSYVGCELNPEYVAMSRRRLGDVSPLLAREVRMTPHTSIVGGEGKAWKLPA